MNAPLSTLARALSVAIGLTAAATAGAQESPTGSVRLIVRLVDEAQGWPEVQATPAPTSRHI